MFMRVEIGQQAARGSVLQGGDFGTIVDGTVERANFHSGDAGGCIAAMSRTYDRMLLQDLCNGRCDWRSGQ